MIPEWTRFWRKKQAEAQREVHRLRDYPEIAAEYQEEADEIGGRFLADAVIAATEDPGVEWDGLDELEKRMIDGDR
jgi:hypothetical protein